MLLLQGTCRILLLLIRQLCWIQRKFPKHLKVLEKEWDKGFPEVVNANKDMEETTAAETV
jgi:hypothetical protein